jgi:hypothetical protein
MGRASPPESTISGGQPRGLCGQFISSLTRTPPYCGWRPVAEGAVVDVAIVVAGLPGDGEGVEVEGEEVEVEGEEVEAEGEEVEAEGEEVEVLELQPMMINTQTSRNGTASAISLFMASSL